MDQPLVQILVGVAKI